jgi:hypothetical protein
VKIVVGSEHASSPSEQACVTWSLPKELVSYYSIVLKEACERPVQEGRETRITLPQDDPLIFELFVEYMYYGLYTTPLSLPTVNGIQSNIDAQAWVLGDSLRSVELKNAAMSRLHESYTINFVQKPKSVTPEDVKYACTNSAVGSKLRQFFFDFVVTHFADSVHVAGTTEEWDEVLVEHADARSFLLRGFRMGNNQRQIIRYKEEYMETEQEEFAAHLRVSEGLRVTLGKRNADGVLMKKEPMDM